MFVHFRYTSEYKNTNSNNLDHNRNESTSSNERLTEYGYDGGDDNNKNDKASLEVYTSHNGYRPSYTTTTSSAINHFTSNIAENQIGNFSVNDFDRKFAEIILTTPETFLFDKIHKQYETDKVNFKQEIDTDDIDDENSRHKPSSQKHDSIISFDAINGNATNEKNSTVYYNNAVVESTNYDLATNEIHNSTINANGIESIVANGTSEKRGKYLQQPSAGTDVNLTIPNMAAVWALANAKSVEHEKTREGQYYNITSVRDDGNSSKLVQTPSKSNNTIVTKQLADWVEVMKHNSFSNNSFGSNDQINGTLTTQAPIDAKITHLLQDSASQENQIVTVRMSPDKIPSVTAPTTKVVPLTPATTIRSPTQPKLSPNLVETNHGTTTDDSVAETTNDDDVISNTLTDDNDDDDDATTTTIAPLADDDEEVIPYHHIDDTDDDDEPSTTQEPIDATLDFKTTTAESIKTTENLPIDTDSPRQNLIETTTADDAAEYISVTSTTIRPDESIESNLVVQTSESNQRSSTSTKAPSVDPKFTTIIIDLDDKGNRTNDWNVVTTTVRANSNVVIRKPEIHIGGGVEADDVDEDDEDDDDDMLLEPVQLENITSTEQTSSSLGSIGGYSTSADEPDVNAIIAISVSVVGVICLILLVGFLVSILLFFFFILKST